MNFALPDVKVGRWSWWWWQTNYQNDQWQEWQGVTKRGDSDQGDWHHRKLLRGNSGAVHRQIIPRLTLSCQCIVICGSAQIFLVKWVALSLLLVAKAGDIIGPFFKCLIGVKFYHYLLYGNVLKLYFFGTVLNSTQSVLESYHIHGFLKYMQSNQFNFSSHFQNYQLALFSRRNVSPTSDVMMPFKSC